MNVRIHAARYPSIFFKLRFCGEYSHLVQIELWEPVLLVFVCAKPVECNNTEFTLPEEKFSKSVLVLTRRCLSAHIRLNYCHYLFKMTQ